MSAQLDLFHSPCFRAHILEHALNSRIPPCDLPGMGGSFEEWERLRPGLDTWVKDVARSLGFPANGDPVLEVRYNPREGVPHFAVVVYV